MSVQSQIVGSEGGGIAGQNKSYDNCFLTSSWVRLTVLITTRESRLVFMEPLAGPLTALVRASRMPLTVSKPLLVCSESKYFPAARVQLSEMKG